MVKIRLKLLGSRKHKFFHIIVSDSRSARNGKFLEQIGYYDPKNPRTRKTTENFVLNREKYNEWIQRGAQPSESLAEVLRNFPVAS